MAGQTPDPKSGARLSTSDRPNTLGLNQRDLVTLLEKLEAGEKGKAPVRRNFTRWPFRHATVRVQLVQPSGGAVALKLACRNLSRGGCSLLHSAFVHPGSQVVVTLPREGGGSRDITGKIKRCSHRRGVLHELGVQFDEEIELRDFLGGGHGVDFFSLEHVNPEKLTGHLLYIEDNEVDYRIVQHFLRETNLTLKRAATGAEALEQMAQGFDIVIADWRLPDMLGTDFILTLRTNKQMIPVLLVTADPVGLMKSGEWAHMPGTGLLSKPLGQQQLLRALAERLLVSREEESHQNEDVPEGETATISAPIRDLLVGLAERLEGAVQTQNAKQATEAALQLRGAAPAVGLPHIGRLADQTATLLETNKDWTAAGKIVRELVTHCKHVQVAA